MFCFYSDGCEIPALPPRQMLLMICICVVQVHYPASQALGKNVSNSGNPALDFGLVS